MGRDNRGQSKIIHIVVDGKNRGNFTLTPDIQGLGARDQGLEIRDILNTRHQRHLFKLLAERPCRIDTHDGITAVIRR